MSDKGSPVQVEIFGQTYVVRAGAEPGHVERLAAFVDGQMSEISRASVAVDSVRIAVLAALNIADDLFQIRDDRVSRDRRAQDSDERLVEARARMTEAERRAQEAAQAAAAANARANAAERRAKEAEERMARAEARATAAEDATQRAERAEKRARQMESLAAEFEERANQGERGALERAEALSRELGAALDG
jgi:cell division protein ZapA (FtsZ GTPase activity inhibitor)